MVNVDQTKTFLSLPEPSQEVRRCAHKADGVHGVPDDLSDCPGKQEEGEPYGQLRGGEQVQDGPSNIHSVF